MAHVDDRWRNADGSPTSRAGSGLRWRVRYTDADRRERSKSFARKTDAEQFATTVAADVLRGVYIDPNAGRVSFRRYAEDWLKGRVDLRPSTRELYAAHLRNHVLPTFGGHFLATIKPSDVRAAVRVWGQLLSPATVHNVHGTLSAVLSAAVADGLIVRNPGTGVPLPQLRHWVLDPLPASSVSALADAVTGRYRVAVFLGAGAGLRLGEALGLTVARVDFLRRRIAVEQQLQPLHSGGAPLLSPLKTSASRRIVPVDDVVLEEVARHLERFGPGPDGLLLANRIGQPVRRSSFGNRWTAAVQAAGPRPGPGSTTCGAATPRSPPASTRSRSRPGWGTPPSSKRWTPTATCSQNRRSTAGGALDAVLRSSDGPARAGGIASP